MSLTALTAKLKYALKHMNPQARRANLGERLAAFEAYGILNHNYAGTQADKTYEAGDLPITSVVCIMLTNADGPANLILPAEVRKAYIIYNNSGQVITAKVAGQQGTQLADGGKYLCSSDGTDIVTFQPEVTLAGTQTLTNKTLTSPTINSPTIATPTITSPDVTLGVATHGYDSGTDAWELDSTELKAAILKASDAGGDVNAIIADTAYKPYLVINETGYELTVKTASGTGITVADDKAAMVMSDGTNVIRLTADVDFASGS